MGNFISVRFTATTDHPIPRPQHLEEDLEVGTDLQYEITASNNENGTNTADEEPNSINGRNSARLRHDHPKVGAYLLRFYLPVSAIVCVKRLIIGGNLMLLPNNIANDHTFMILSLVAFCMALLILSLLSWMYEHSEENEGSGPSSGYKILKGIYYIFCNLAYFSLLPVLFTNTN